MAPLLADVLALRRKSRPSGESSLPWHRSDDVFTLRKQRLLSKLGVSHQLLLIASGVTILAILL